MYGFPVKWGKATNMEAVTHSMLGPLMQKTAVGAFKTLDALDFSIEHLSLYERRQGHWFNRICRNVFFRSVASFQFISFVEFQK